MMFVPYREHVYGSPRHVTGIALFFICIWSSLTHRKHVYGFPRHVTGIALLLYISKYTYDLRTNKNFDVDSNRARNENRLCWREWAAICCTAINLKHSCTNIYIYIYIYIYLWAFVAVCYECRRVCGASWRATASLEQSATAPKTLTQNGPWCCVNSDTVRHRSRPFRGGDVFQSVLTQGRL
jgi:hypothetical protein